MNKITRKRPTTMYLMAKIYEYSGLYDRVGLGSRYRYYRKYFRKQMYKYPKNGRFLKLKKYEQYVKEYYDYAEYELNPLYSN